MTSIVEEEALVLYPDSQTFSKNALLRAFALVLPSIRVQTKWAPQASDVPSFQFSDYDAIEWDPISKHPDRTLVSAYAIRKALTRKHHLCQTIAQYVAKNPTSILKTSVPTTYPFQISFAEELDELWSDELYDLGNYLDSKSPRCWILKPAMADRGQGIRLFRSKAELQEILASFDEQEEEVEEEQAEGCSEGLSTDVALSSIRWWVAQSYISDPYLLDPGSTSLPPRPRKFHLRVYVLAVGALSLYMCTDILALFAPLPYSQPSADPDNPIELASQLTNTCLQYNASASDKEANVLLLESLIGDRGLTRSEYDAVSDRIADVLSETWKAALGSGSDFQPLPNAFEIFGVDVLLDSRLHPQLLEVNSGPDFAQTGDALSGVIDRLFVNTLKVVAEPFYARMAGEAIAGAKPDTPNGLRKCLQVEVRRWS